MANPQGICPYCAVVAPWHFSGINFSLPPTGGDYDWVETDASVSCPTCNKQFTVRVRVDLEGDDGTQLMNSPMPQTEDWERIVVVEITRFSPTLVSVEIIAIAENEAEAQEILKRAGGTISTGYKERTILHLSRKGYHKRDGTILHKSAHSAIQYHSHWMQIP